jgi:hypothetical protein
MSSPCISRLGVFCLLLTVLAGNGAALAASPPSADVSTVKAGRVQTAAAVGTNASATLPSVAVIPVVPPAATNKTELDAMKEEFAGLMKKRAELGEQYRQGLSSMAESRSMQAGNQFANSETGTKYREATLRVERALDEHPQIKALQMEYDVAQTQKVAVSKEKGEVLAAWRKSANAEESEYRAKVEAAKQKSATAKGDLFKSIGLTGESNQGKNARELTEAETNRLMAIQDQLMKELNALKDDRDAVKRKAREQEAHEKDGSAKKYAELVEQYKALEARQADLKSGMGALRGSLRKSDSAIAALAAEAAGASQAHLVAVDASSQVAGARQIVLGFGKAQGDIDKRARFLRRAILAKDAESKATLDAQASAGGLGQVSEDFWKIEG